MRCGLASIKPAQGSIVSVLLYVLADGKTYALYAIFRPYLGHATNARNARNAILWH